MARPTVAIVGKPNVGKSTFFNYLIGERKSIVEDTPGVTRDRVYGETNWRGKVSRCNCKSDENTSGDCNRII